jgi:ribosomal protein L37AE/L43A
MSHFNDGLENEGDIVERDDGSVWELTKCGWTFVKWKKEEELEI